MDLDADLPITKKDQDKLNRDVFAKNLANAINHQEHHECLTIGLIGKWGVGKSSIINLTKNYLNQDKLIIIDFNPWYFSTQNNLYQQFFNLLSSEIEKREFGDKFWIKKKIYQFKTQWNKLPKITGENKTKTQYIKDRIYSLRELRNNDIINTYYNHIKSNSAINFNVPGVGYTYNFDESKKEYNSISYLKLKCDEYFNGFDYKFLVIIDDIDRMTNTEIEQIFILVKSLANFPNFIYILSFDKEVVVNSLIDVPEDFRNDFIEKIIQIPIVVPEISVSDFDGYVVDEIKTLYYKYLNENFRGEDEFNQIIWIINYFIKNVRDLKRYVNSINFYSYFIGELNVNDMFILIAIHTFEYELYLKIKEDFGIIIKDELIYLRDKEDVKEKLSVLLNESKLLLKHISGSQFESVVFRLFPIFDSGSDKERILFDSLKLEMEGRISSPAHFDKYFTLTIENNEISLGSLSNFFKLNEVSDIYDYLLLEKEKGSFKSFILNFRHFIEKIPQENAKFYIYALMKYGDNILLDNDEFNTFESIMWVLFRNINSKEELFNILKNCIYDENIFFIGNIIYILSYYYGHVGNYNEDIPDEYELLNETDLFELEKLLVKKLKELLISKKLFDHERFGSLLFFWCSIESEESVGEYLEAYVRKEDEKIIIKDTINNHRDLGKFNKLRNLFN